MGGGTNKTTTSSSPTNSNVVNATNKLLSGIDAAWAKGPTVFNENLYGGQGATTKQGIQNLIGSASNPAFSSGVQGAIGSFGRTASGANLGTNDPGFATLRRNLSDDVLRETNASFNNSGLFGSDNNQGAAAEGLATALGGLDYQQYNDSLDRQVQAAGMLPGLYEASQLPASTLLGAGALQDADKQATLQGRYDLSQRQGNAQTDLLAKLSAILSGNAAASGTTTTTQTPQTPWWQSAVGIGLGLL